MCNDCPAQLPTMAREEAEVCVHGVCSRCAAAAATADGPPPSWTKRNTAGRPDPEGSLVRACTAAVAPSLPPGQCACAGRLQPHTPPPPLPALALPRASPVGYYRACIGMRVAWQAQRQRAGRADARKGSMGQSMGDFVRWLPGGRGGRKKIWRSHGTAGVERMEEDERERGATRRASRRAKYRDSHSGKTAAALKRTVGGRRRGGAAAGGEARA